MKTKYCRLSYGLVWLVVFISLVGCAGGPRELADRHEPSDAVPINYASYKDLSFSEYIVSISQSLKKYNGLHRSDDQLLQILPFEISSKEYNACDADKRTGVLLIHGLTDTPFLMRDIGQALITQNDCLLVRAIVLPGHATVPGDLLTVKYAIG